MKRTVSARIILVIYLLAVAFVCFWHFNNVFTETRHFLGIEMDKIVHFLMFLPFPPLAYASAGRVFRKQAHIILFISTVFAMGAAVAVSIEVVQSHLPYRSADPKDFMADVIALAVGCFCVYILNSSRKK